MNKKYPTAKARREAHRKQARDWYRLKKGIDVNAEKLCEGRPTK